MAADPVELAGAGEFDDAGGAAGVARIRVVLLGPFAYGDVSFAFGEPAGGAYV